MTAPAAEAAELLHLVERAEGGRLLPGEADLMRDGIRQLDARATRAEAAAERLRATRRSTQRARRAHRSDDWE
ncbi:hypothetical protein N0X72_25425 [Streptomyces carpaticus]|uniref:hypothetical protein n=1 Tax=Streptomyces carpaticus TaxID=285558 RepID=UPI002202BD32|nr:hypothetical protein N0X72_25425 [Streptomyces carpaticus]